MKALRPFRTPWISHPTTLRRIPKDFNLHHYKKVTAGYLLPFQVSLHFHHKQTQDDDTLAHTRVVTSISLQSVLRCDGLDLRKVSLMTAHHALCSNACACVPVCASVLKSELYLACTVLQTLLPFNFEGGIQQDQGCPDITGTTIDVTSKEKLLTCWVY